MPTNVASLGGFTATPVAKSRSVAPLPKNAGADVTARSAAKPRKQSMRVAANRGLSDRTSARKRA